MGVIVRQLAQLGQTGWVLGFEVCSGWVGFHFVQRSIS